MNIDIGIAKPTNNAFLSPRKKVKTVTTRIIPKIKLFIKSFTELIVYSDWSFWTTTSRFAGKKLSLASLIISWIEFEAKIAFSPPLFTTSSITVFLSNDLVYDVISFSLNDIEATSSR